MTRLRFELVEGRQLSAYVESLSRLEAAITYPVGDGEDRFRIDHGKDYHPFFSALGDARFLLALGPSDEVHGMFAGIVRRAEIGGRTIATAYACDLKVDREHRGTGLARRMLTAALARSISERELRGWRIAFAGAMRGARGDVLRSVRGMLHPGRLVRPLARLQVYFADPRALAALPDDGPRPPPGPGYDFSPPPTSAEINDAPLRALAAPRGPGLVSTAGRKDLFLESTGRPWPLEHLSLGPSRWSPTWGAYLRECGRFLGGADVKACFAIDDRLADHVAWLDGHGIAPGAVCTVHALVLPLLPRRPAWVHLATSEI